MSILYKSRIIGDVSATGLRGTPALGSHQLVFDLDVETNPSWQGEFAILGLSGRASVQGSARGADLGRLHMLGPQQVPLLPGNRLSIQMEAEVSPHALAAIEDLRCGLSIAFAISLAGSLWHREGLPTPFQTQATGPDVGRERWLQVLEQCGYARTMLLEVPLEETIESESQAKDLQFLRHAQEALLVGNWRESVGLCRDALEHLPIAIGEVIDPAVEAKLRDQLKGNREWGKTERFRAVRHALMLVAHAARHADEATARIDWERVDAQSVLAMTTALVRQARSKSHRTT